MILIDTKPINVKSFHAGCHRLLSSLFCSPIFKTPQILNLQGISKLVQRGACPGAPGARPFLPCCTFPLCGLVLPCWPADRMEGSPPPPPPPPASHEPTVTRPAGVGNQPTGPQPAAPPMKPPSRSVQRPPPATSSPPPAWCHRRPD